MGHRPYSGALTRTKYIKVRLLDTRIVLESIMRIAASPPIIAIPLPQLPILTNSTNLLLRRPVRRYQSGRISLPFEDLDR